MIYLCRIPLCCSPQLRFQLFVGKRKMEQDKQSQRPSPPFLCGSRQPLERWWLGRKADPPSSPSLAAWRAGTVRPGRAYRPPRHAAAPGARPAAPQPRRPGCGFP